MARKNLAISTVATAPSPATSGVSLVVAAGDGATFPAVPFNATIWPASTAPTTANAEIVRVTAISTDTLTITRAQESTSARTVIVGDQIAASISVRHYEESLAAAVCGDGSDGAITLDGTTTYPGLFTTTGAAPNLQYFPTRDIYATDLTVSSGKILTTSGWRIYCAGTLRNAGQIRSNNTTAPGAASGGSVGGGGAGGAGIGTGTTNANGIDAANIAVGYHNLGGLGGVGGGDSTHVGGQPGALQTIAGIPGELDLASLLAMEWKPPAAAVTSAPAATVIFTGGGGGGSGGRTAGTVASGQGEGGGGGGVVWIACRALDNTGGFITSDGVSGRSASAGDCKMGGGAGGGGGVLVLLYGQLIARGTIHASGGVVGQGINSASIAATAGAAGRVIEMVLA